MLDSEEFQTPVSEKEIDNIRAEVEETKDKAAKESLKEGDEEQPEQPAEDAPIEEQPTGEEPQPIETTVEEVKEVATEIAEKVAEPVEDEEAAEEQEAEIKEIVDDVVDDKFGEANPEGENAAEAPDGAAMLEEPKLEDEIDDLDECSLNKHVDEYLKEVYSNVKSYETTGCELKEGKLFVEGKITFNSGKEKPTIFEFLPAYDNGKLFFEGVNKDFSEDKAFKLNCSINESKALITESFGYSYKINEALVEGLK